MATESSHVATVSNLISVSDIVYCNVSSSPECAYVNTAYFGSNYNYSLSYWFKNSKTLYVNTVIATTWSSPHIYKIEGIK
jgi:hypothetical protein